MSQHRLLPVFLLTILSLIWGSSFFLIKTGNMAFSFDQVATLRVSISMLCSFPFAIAYFRKTSMRDMGFVALTSFIGNGIPAFLFPLGETVLPSAVAGVLNSLSPLFVLLTGWLIFKTLLPGEKIWGIAIGFVGAAVIALTSSGEEKINFQQGLLYGGIIVFATFLYGLSTNITGFKIRHLHPMQITSLGFLFLGIPGLIWLFGASDFLTRIHEQPAAMKSLVAIFILSAVGSVFALVLYYKLLKIKGPASASTVTYIMPIVALGWGMVDGEKLILIHFGGMALIIAGVYLVNRKAKEKKE